MINSRPLSPALPKRSQEALPTSTLMEKGGSPYWQGRTLKVHSEFISPVEGLRQVCQATPDLWHEDNKTILNELYLAQSCAIAGTCIKEFPPKSWTYAPVGRSPAPVGAALEVMQGTDESVCYLPFTGATCLQIDTDSMNWMYQDKISLTNKETVLDHFRNFVPSDKCRGKNILLIDFVKTGASLYVAHCLMKELIENDTKYHGCDVYSLGLTAQNPEENDFRMADRSPESIKSHSYALFDKETTELVGGFYVSFFKEKAKYPKECNVLSIDPELQGVYVETVEEFNKIDCQLMYQDACNRILGPLNPSNSGKDSSDTDDQALTGYQRLKKEISVLYQSYYSGPPKLDH